MRAMLSFSADPHHLFDGFDDTWDFDGWIPAANDFNYELFNGDIVFEDFGIPEELIVTENVRHYDDAAYGTDTIAQLDSGLPNVVSRPDLDDSLPLSGPVCTTERVNIGSGQSYDDSTPAHLTSLPTSCLSRTIPSATVTDETLGNLEPKFEIVQYNHKKPQSKFTSKGQIKRKKRALTSRSNVLKTEKAPKKSLKRDANGKIAGTMTVFGLSQIVRTPISRELQLATSVTRRVGACERCHKNRLRCNRPEDEYQPCEPCKNLVWSYFKGSKPSLYHRPCIRVGLADLCLHRKGPTIYNDLQMWVEIKQGLLDCNMRTSTQTVYLTQGFGEGPENALSLQVSRFEPLPNDRTAYFWTDGAGRFRSMELPPYFISDMEAARESVCRFVRQARSTYIETLLADSNPIVRQTFQAALTYTVFDQASLVTNALDLWVAARLIEERWRILWGWEPMGLEPPDEAGHPWEGVVPITPMMDTQLDDLVIRQLLAPLTTQYLKRLEKKIDERKNDNWLEIYLAIFIVMSNTGWIIKDMIANATWKGLKPGSRGGSLTKSYMHACKTMLSHFHFVCAGSIPLLSNSNNTGTATRTQSDLLLGQAEYFRLVQQEIGHQGTKISEWSGLSMYDDDAYWCYQLLSKDWRGDLPHAGEIDDFTENDFLSSSGS